MTTDAEVKTDTAEEPASTRTTLLTAAVTTVLLAAGLFVYARSGATSVELIGAGIFLVPVFTLAVLAIRFSSVQAAAERFFEAGDRVLKGMFLALLPPVIFNFLSKYLMTSLSLPFQVTLFVVWGVLLVLAIWLIATERNRERLFTPKRNIAALVTGDPRPDGAEEQAVAKNVGKKSGWTFGLSSITPVVYSLDLLAIAAMFFATVTFVLVDQGLITLTAAAESPATYDSVLFFYFWHFLEAVPLLKVNDTLQWKAPLTYQPGLVGFLLLVFKLAVIIPVIAAFTWYWKKMSADDEKTK